MSTPRTSQRVAIESVIRTATGPKSPTEVLDLARREVPTLSLATVYRTLKRMVEAGELVTVELSGQPPRYERAQVAEVHHHHFWCDGCDIVFDLQGCVQGLGDLLPRGFQMTNHDLTIRGRCPDCREASEAWIQC